VYTYTNRAGRPVYVQGLDAVPPEARAKARRVDSSEVDPNEQLANAIRDSTSAQYEALKKREAEQKAKEAEARARAQADADARDGLLVPVSPGLPIGGSDVPCRPAGPPDPTTPTWRAAWARFPAPIAAGGVCVALLLATPFVLRHVAAAKWVRTLLWALPLLAFLGALAHTVRAVAHGARSPRALLAGGACVDRTGD